MVNLINEKIESKIALSKQKLNEIPFRKLAPNMLTMMALCSGVTSIRYSVSDNWVKAVLCIFLAALFDGLDGRVARFLKASSKFGAELDSLSDFVSFGVAPAILIYQWSLYDLPKFGWLFCLIFAMGMAMRLARFNTMLDMENVPEYWSHYFVGVPAPAAAALGMMPVLIWFDFPELEFLLRSNAFCAVLMCLVTFLMVSRIPTISVKKTKVKTTWFVPLMLLAVLFINFMLTQPWLTLGVMTCLYLISIPLSCLKFQKDKKRYERKRA
ncbi:MAG TPA: CDP-diacylglycerol--serine O-phosphatidyltransferase [Alphaproteobacteria bacterium]|nr:CDP-diacylglycerol--serine O-phosphatidyltransferase [Alphaproteobacteria bacterium]